MIRVKQIWNNLRSSFWFIPALMIFASGALAVAVVEMDTVASDQWLAHWPRLFGTTPEGARQIVATIAGSMMTILGVTFSMTLVALALASSQYTSRILRNFMRSRVTQSTLGILAGNYTYCLVVLHTIRGGVSESVFVPGLALFFAFILAQCGVGVLIYFIHHIASSIQASNIIASVAEETILAIDRLFPEKLGQESDEDEDRGPPAGKTWHVVPVKTEGYIQDVNISALLHLAQDLKAVVRMERGIGEFVVQNTALASLALEGPPDQDAVTALQGAYSIDIHRTVEQDPAFGIMQIVDIAQKALSPGINDTSTAAICIDHLTAILARLVIRKFPGLRRYDEGDLRVIAKGPTFEVLLCGAFDQIRRNAQGNVAILSHMLSALETIASQTDRPSRRLALREQVRRIAAMAGGIVDSAHDRPHLEAHLQQVRNALEVASATSTTHSRLIGTS
ncbi:MAG: DUF2254 domain-containing protein [Planctomycetota bacterium]|jgi:uncharacterized membrane protein|nr:DUF2254 domain-containing protein [Planctomycetota bacterium]